MATNLDRGPRRGTVRSSGQIEARVISRGGVRMTEFRNTGTMPQRRRRPNYAPQQTPRETQIYIPRSEPTSVVHEPRTLMSAHTRDRERQAVREVRPGREWVGGALEDRHEVPVRNVRNKQVHLEAGSARDIRTASRERKRTETTTEKPPTVRGILKNPEQRPLEFYDPYCFQKLHSIPNLKRTTGMTDEDLFKRYGTTRPSSNEFFPLPSEPRASSISVRGNVPPNDITEQPIMSARLSERHSEQSTIPTISRQNTMIVSPSHVRKISTRPIAKARVQASLPSRINHRDIASLRRQRARMTSTKPRYSSLTAATHRDDGLSTTTTNDNDVNALANELKDKASIFQPEPDKPQDTPTQASSSSRNQEAPTDYRVNGKSGTVARNLPYQAVEETEPLQTELDKTDMMKKPIALKALLSNRTKSSEKTNAESQESARKKLLGKFKIGRKKEDI